MTNESKSVLAALTLHLILVARPTLAVERPFVLWTRGDLDAMKQRIEKDQWAEAEWNRQAENRAEASLHDLLAYQLFGDKEAGDRQKERLLKLVRSRPPLGGAQWVIVVTFDMSHDLLSAEERAEVERVFRAFIDQAIFRNALFDSKEFNTSRSFQRYDAKYYTRTNWLPNITWPRRVSANLMAAALGDEELIRRVWSHYGSWQWYFDEYLSDGGFYGEEFSKMGATPGTMLVYCRAVRNLGLNELGFGYRGRGGSTLRGHLESLIRLGYPRVDLHSERPHYPMLTTGDLRGEGSSRQGKNLPTFAFQHAIVRGYLPGPADRGIHRWQAHGAWGGEQRGNNPQWDGYSGFTPKMQLPLWFEAGHAEWPDTGFDYFLHQMRTPEETRYRPTLHFGLAPVDPPLVRPPPAPSWVAEDRGLAMLRAEESPAYWESPKPAVGMRLGANYAHNVNDSLSLSGFYALHRPIYLNRQTRRGYAFGYSRSVLSHCGVMVDGGEPRFTKDVVTRHDFYPPFKFLAVTSPTVYPSIDATRALVLADRYLLDVFRLSAKDEGDHDFIWVVHALGVADVPGTSDGEAPDTWPSTRLEGPLSVFGEAWTPPATENAEVSVVQRLALDDASGAKLPSAWYDRKIGVKLVVAGREETELYVARTPTDDPENRKLKDPAGYLELEEVGGTSIILRRNASETAFVTLHVPFEGGTAPPVRVVAHPTGDEEVLAIEVAEPQSDASRDWLLVDLRDEAERRTPYPVRIGDHGEFVFTGHAFVRVGGREVHAWGDLRDLRLEGADAETAYTLNGRATSW